MISKELAEQMLGVWTVASIESQPELTLARWQVLETDKNERHFVGWAVENYEGRVSSAIQTFDVKTLRGVTQSGRVYQLRGKPGEDRDAAHTWATYVFINDVKSVTDVTQAIWAEVQSATDAPKSCEPVTSNPGAAR